MDDLRTDFADAEPLIDETTSARLVKWTSDLSVSSPTLDLHHQILVGCLNRMIVLEQDWRDSLPAVRRELAIVISYCKIHFFIEEEAMKRARVPDATREEHKAVHRRILAKMDQALTAFNTDPLAFPFPDTLKFLHMWLVRHIQDEDKRHYADALRAERSVEPDIARYRYAEISRKLSLRQDPNRTRPGADSLAGRWVSVIESNMERRTMLIRTLQDQGMKVSHAKSVLDAPAIIDANVPELLFLDWSVKDAAPFARDLYCKRNTLVVATHFGDPLEIIDACDILGIANILAYPCSAKDIVQLTQETLDGLVPLRALVLERLQATA